MKKILIPLLLFNIFTLFSQKKSSDYNYGIVTLQEKSMTVYDKDSTANAVVLYEHSDSDFVVRNYYVYIRTVIYKKIKLFNTNGFEHADVSIPIHNNDNLEEKVVHVKAITHNKTSNTHLKQSNIYYEKINERWSEMKFALPDLQEGSVVEYYYIIESPFKFNFKGWDFQSDIPKVESVFKAKIPGNYFYNRKLTGPFKLAVNDVQVKKDCFRIEGIAGSANCEVLTYSMKDIPAFVEEDYLTTKDNFISRIAFELSTFTGFDGKITKYTTDWKSVDKDYKKDGDIGGQLKRKGFFENVIPTEILEESNTLEKAKSIFYYIQNHYTWNGDYKLFSDMNVKRAFKDKIGTVGEINMSLINALDAADIKTELVLLSTRNNGFPTKIHPVITDFNYIVAKTVIDGKTYFLDATDKLLPFGILPFRCLNKDARVMDFKNGSYWEEIIPINDNRNKIIMMLDLYGNGDINGKMRVTNSGYNSINKREELDGVSKEKYLEKVEESNEGLEIHSYINKNLKDVEKPIIEEFEISYKNILSVGDKIYLNPFFIDKIEENPFKLDSREYPVDFGYSKQFDFLLTLTIPEEYEIESIPQNKAVTLPNKGGVYSYVINFANNKININFKYSLNKPYFYSNEYQYLKELFKQIIISQEEPIILKKK
ncbi:DUF3857 domain-containing protein [Urechidicola croceus]|uniref:DUF3857 domain-containing protein n=1 Tax=Urechidicola croceus TaxID=1850246 RepID=A0A1D8P517_9FLAO|nr:DUF3857 domain-containing protein [Urechidicola croceus]AOW19668.1 hypothetical protein LPB138_02775 [Urechidicola croceus]